MAEGERLFSSSSTSSIETRAWLAFPQLAADAPDLPALAAVTTKTIGQMIPAGVALLLSWAHDYSAVRILAAYGLAPEAHAALIGRVIAAAELRHVDVFLRGGSIPPGAEFVLDVAFDAAAGKADADLRAVPIMVRGKTAGTLLVRGGNSEIPEPTFVRLEHIVVQYALAVDNLLLKEDRRVRDDYLRRETAVLHALAGGEAFEKILRGVAEAIDSYTNGHCAIVLVDHRDASVRVQAAPSLPAALSSAIEIAPIANPSRSSPTTVTTVPDLAAREQSGIAAAALRSGLRASVSVPIPDGTKTNVQGTLDVYYPSPHDPDERELEVLDHAAQLIRISLDKSAVAGGMGRAAQHDALTELPDRLLFIATVERAITRPREMPVAVALLDVDDFTSINERLGHAAADDLLAEIARRLRGCLRPGETAGRFGGDEFAVLIVDADASAAEAVAARMLAAVAEPVSLNGKKVCARTSIGIAIGRGSEDDAEALIRCADAAMRTAKRDGKACIRIFDEAMHAEIRQRLDIEEDLPGAIDRNELVVHYQPVVMLHTGRVVDVEALVRWRHPRLGTVPPGRFIPVAEERGIISAIGAWVLRRALSQLQSWRTNIPDAAPRRVAVNVSARQLTDGDLVGDIKTALLETGLHGSDLTLEITETLLMEDIRTAKEKLRALRDLGVHIAVDDFGSGYASLSYLKQFPIDILKIDRGIIADIDGPPEASALPHAIVKLGHSLRMRIVAEGIERIPQRDRLIELGCALGQGYLFSKPLAAPELEDFLRESGLYDASESL